MRPRDQQPAEGRSHADQRHRGRPGRAVRRRGAACPGGGPPTGPDDPVLQAALAAAETGDSVEAVAAAIGLPISRTRAALGRLEVDGYLVRRDLGGWERTAR